MPRWEGLCSSPAFRREALGDRQHPALRTWKPVARGTLSPGQRMERRSILGQAELQETARAGSGSVCRGAGWAAGVGHSLGEKDHQVRKWLGQTAEEGGPS